MAFDFDKIIPSLEPPAITALPLEECLAKTSVDSNGLQRPGCTIEAHSRAVCLVLRELQKIYVATPASAIFSPATEWLAALHDLGKVTPVFQEKIYAALKIKKQFGISLTTEDHALSSELLLQEQFGNTFAKIAGAHHGSGFLSTSYHTADAQRLGGPKWQTIREQLIQRLQSELSLPAFSTQEINEENLSVIVGAIILADWLGSSMDIPHGVNPDRDWVAQTVASAGFHPLVVKENLLFEDIFPFSPNPLQNILQQQVRPGSCYVIEAEMGSGKTEAALYLAYKCMEVKKATGIYFALPTQLTSEKIQERMDDFLEKILPDKFGSESLLIHGQAWLKWNIFQENDDGVAETKPNSWFYAPKRALLAPFAVGTVDQALMAVINVKHRDLRAFALAGKVVIIDEVHSYDAYTGTLINELVRNLQNWGCTVIILSATLSTAVKNNFMTTADKNKNEFSSAYPLVSTQHQNIQHCFPVPPVNVRQIALAHVTEETECLEEALQSADSGQQVLWIENTIYNAQRLYQLLASAALGTTIEIGLIHSRFPQFARSEKESNWVSLYGKKGAPTRLSHGRILIGTQVLEQSLDIDADLLITRLAPTDMIFQRLGRLWRHYPTLPRADNATCRAIILHSLNYTDSADDLYGSRHDDLPYERYIMMRTQEIWLSKQSVAIPNDIRPAIEETYAERSETGVLARLKNDLRTRIQRMHGRARISTSNALNVIDDEAAKTRLNDQPQVHLLLIANNNRGAELSEKIWTPFFEEPIIIPPKRATAEEKKEALKKLGLAMIKTSANNAPAYESFTLDEALSHLMYLGGQDFRPVRAAYLDQSGFLLDKASNYAHYDNERFRYNPNLGLLKEKDS